MVVAQASRVPLALPTARSAPLARPGASPQPALSGRIGASSARRNSGAAPEGEDAAGRWRLVQAAASALGVRTLAARHSWRSCRAGARASPGARVARAAGGGEGETEADDEAFSTDDLVNQLIQRSRKAGDLGISTVEWHTELYDEVPEGYQIALEQGLDFVDVLAGNPMVRLLKDENADVSPRYCVRVAPRATFGLGLVLNKALVHKWTVLGPLESTMKQLDVDYVDLMVLQSEGQGRLSFPFWVYDAAAEACRSGLCNKVGVCQEFASIEDIRRVQDELQQRGVSLSCVIVSLSLLSRRALELIEECGALGIQVFAQSPLGQNELASGRYTAANPTGGEISVPNFTLAQLMPLRGLHEAMASVAGRARARTEKAVDTTQVALQWVRSKGASPLCDVATETNAKALAGCEGWELLEDELAQLDEASEEVARNRPRGYRG